MKNRVVKMNVSLLAALVFGVFIATGSSFAAGPVETHSWTLGYEPDQTLTFNNPPKGKPLKLDLFFPADHKAGQKIGCVILFFGGGWSAGSTEQFYGYSKYFASRGLVAVAAQYRTKKSHKAIPRNCVEDGKEAIRYVRAHATELGVDPDRIVAGGGSAGGHVAAASALCPEIDANPESPVSCRPNALMLFNPVYDNGPDGYGHSRVKAYWKELSPFHNIVPGLPPTIVFFGDNDKHVPLATINRFQEKMETAGNQCETHIYESQAHGFFHISKGGRHMYEDVLIKADGFLVKNGFLTGKDNVLEWTKTSIENLSETSEVKKAKGALSSGKKKRSEK
jgi:acetyl esterase